VINIFYILIYDYHLIIIYIEHDHFYDGRVFGEISSHASVHLDEGVMTAIIDVPGETYHIEVNIKIVCMFKLLNYYF